MSDEGIVGRVTGDDEFVTFSPPPAEEPDGYVWPMDLHNFVRRLTVESLEKGYVGASLHIGVDASAMQRNQFSFRAEAYGEPMTPEESARLKAWKLEQQRPSVRLRKRYRIIKVRLIETWDVLRHGMPESEW